jgi:hypothetical protein
MFLRCYMRRKCCHGSRWGVDVDTDLDEGLLGVEPGWCEAWKVTLNGLRRAAMFGARSNVCSENIQLL